MTVPFSDLILDESILLQEMGTCQELGETLLINYYIEFCKELVKRLIGLVIMSFAIKEKNQMRQSNFISGVQN